jgi:hypothetical protein
MAALEDTSRSYSPHAPYPQPHYRDTNKEQVTPEDGDVLMQLDAALDSLAHTRNSNEPLTEAITHHQQRSVAAPSNVRDPSPLSMSSVDPLRSRLDDPPPSTTSTVSTVATSISAPSPSTLTPTDMTVDDKKPSRGRRASIQSMLYWDDFGMEDLMIMIRGSAKCQEAMEKKEAEKKNRRSSRHYTAPIRSEINEVFKDSHVQLEQLEKVKATFDVTAEYPSLSNTGNLLGTGYAHGPSSQDLLLMMMTHIYFAYTLSRLLSLYFLFLSIYQSLSLSLLTYISFIPHLLLANKNHSLYHLCTLFF